MYDLVSKFVKSLEPYKSVSNNEWLFRHDPEALKIDWNESLIAPSPKVIAKTLDFLKHGKNLQWYPRIENAQLLCALSKYTGKNIENILVFNGSDSALDCIAKTYIDPEDEVIICTPTYDNFRIYVECRGALIKKAFYSNPFNIEIQKITALKTKKTKAIYLVHPNNPTGITYSLEQISDVAEKFKDSMIIIDEAYYEFCGKSMISLVDTHPNIIITRTFSKAFGLAGFRCGYVVTNKENVNFLKKTKNTKEVNMLAQIAAIAALEDIEYMNDYVREVIASKKKIQAELKSLKINSHFGGGNFFLLQSKDSVKLEKQLAEQKIFVRNFNQTPQLENMLRITIGHLEPMEKFLCAIKKIDKNLF